MKKRILTIVILCLFVSSYGQKASYNMATFNIRYANPNDGINYWDYRKDWASESIRFFDVDVFGAQEVIKTQLDDMVKRLPEYKHVGIGRNGGDEGEFCPVFYKKNKFELLDHHTFWLSKTPDVVNSKDWDAALPRIVTWVKLKEKTSGKVFYFFNTHFDHKGKIAQVESAKLLSKKVKEIAKNTPFIITGDFNISPSNKAYAILTQTNEGFILDTKHKSEMVYGPSYTFNGFQLEPNQKKERIDYVFCSQQFQILKHHTLDGQRGKNYISDHFPIIVTSNF